MTYSLRMMKAQILSYCRRTGLSALTALALCMQPALGSALSLDEDQSSATKMGKALYRPQAQKKDGQIGYDTYILGPGDGLQIELLDVPELSGVFSIGPDGAIYLPRLRALSVEGLTIAELRIYLKQQFSKYVIDPQVYIRPIAYRPIRVYVGGEVKRPGYYTLTGVQSFEKDSNMNKPIKNNKSGRELELELESELEPTTYTFSSEDFKPVLFPTVFDAI